MRLKSLELYGFKSFAEKVKLTFHENFEAIVGPNGSGKSNISDAIRWVLGEQSAKALRGEKMEDVIFSGTEKKSQMNLAQVTITFDNSDGAIPLPYEEVSVSRKVYRSGESQYLINHQIVRRKDVHELFLDTGVGKDGYSMIGQGRIEDILSSRSEDRRAIFEEAAGISKLKYKKTEAERRLDRTSSHLDKVLGDFHLKEQELRILKKQADNARLGYKLTQELEQHELSLLQAQLDQVEEKIRRNQADTRKLQADRDACFSENMQIEEALAPFRQSMDSYDAEHDRLQGVIRSLELRLQQEESDQAIRNQEQSFRSREMERIAEESAVRSEQIRKLRVEEEALKKEKSEIERKLHSLVEKLSGDTDEGSEPFEELEKKLHEARKTQTDLTAKLSILEFERHSQEEADRHLAEEQKQKGAELQILVQELRSETEWIAERKEALKNAADQLEDTQTQLRRNEEQRAVLEKKIEEISLADRKQEAEQARVFSEQRVVQSLIDHYEGYSKSVQQLLRLGDQEPAIRAKFRGTLADLIHVKSPYETAIDVVLGGSLQNIVVDTEKDARDLIQLLKERRLGRITFLPIEKIRGMKPVVSHAPQELINACDALEFEEELRGIVEHFLARTTIVQNIDDAIALSHRSGFSNRIVSLEGDILSSWGSMVGGSVSKRSSASLLNREKQLEDFRETLRALEEKRKLHAEALVRLGEKKEALAADFSRHQGTVEHLRNTISAGREELALRESKLEMRRAKLSELETFLSQAAQYSEESYQSRKTDLQRQKKSLEEQIGTLTAQLESIRKKTQESDKQKALLRSEKEYAQRDLLLSENRISDLQERLENLTQKEKSDQEVLVSLKKQNDVSRAQNEQSIQDREKQSKAKIQFAEQLQKLEEGHHDIAQRVEKQLKRQNELKDLIGDADNQMYRLNFEMETLKNKKADLRETYREQYDLSLEDVENRLSKLAPVETTRAKVSSIKQQLSQIGYFNFDSIEEYEVLAEEVDFLKKQMEDLTKSKSDIEELIGNLDHTMRETFEAGFQQINEQYNRIFRILFGGGHARLSLDGGDLLSAGIEIEAQPPGKKLQSLALLSGGERSMTALALLFAIFAIHPTPFCILDEIDASLDEANIGRYVNFLQTLTDTTQFLVITHRKTTMELAQTLYGVTMEKGVTKVVALKLSDYDKESGSL
ncbi:MAG: chromosome segregation protein SMC [Peptoniphilaceae bacterium]|nr:chromosome segregation protein SMC [Peptoniphilaceae bacterium]MDY5766117.1 chromosome segregation protein SMC [Peptoniphilaceae bacterium]